MVAYRNPPAMLRDAIVSFLKTDCHVQLTIVDNSPSRDLSSSLKDLAVNYHFYGDNVGFGKGHNWVICSVNNSRYHIILNPDIIISPSTIGNLIAFMNDNPAIGIVSPKILNEDGTIQFLNKRYPSVFDLFLRRFIPSFLQNFFHERLDRYEMKDVGYDNICDVECISGCFMFCRTDVLKAVGGFDSRYFMYLEDFDLCREVQKAGYRTVYYPFATVTHIWERASHKSLNLARVHIHSAIKYFNKWGWKFF